MPLRITNLATVEIKIDNYIIKPDHYGLVNEDAFFKNNGVINITSEIGNCVIARDKITNSGQLVAIRTGNKGILVKEFGSLESTKSDKAIPEKALAPLGLIN